MMNETGCDAVMIGRASLGNLWIFRDVISSLAGKGAIAGPSRGDRQAMILRHLDLEMAYCGEMPGFAVFESISYGIPRAWLEGHRCAKCWGRFEIKRL